MLFTNLVSPMSLFLVLVTWLMTWRKCLVSNVQSYTLLNQWWFCLTYIIFSLTLKITPSIVSRFTLLSNHLVLKIKEKKTHLEFGWSETSQFSSEASILPFITPHLLSHTHLQYSFGILQIYKWLLYKICPDLSSMPVREKNELNAERYSCKWSLTDFKPWHVQSFSINSQSYFKLLYYPSQS